MRSTEVLHDPSLGTWTMPRLPEHEPALIRTVAAGLRELSIVLTSSLDHADFLVGSLRSSWTGSGATAGPLPLVHLREDTEQVRAALESMAAALERLAAEFDHAQHEQGVAWKKMAIVATVVAVTAVAVTVSVASAGTAAPAAVAVEGAVVAAAAHQMAAASVGAARAGLAAAEALTAAARLARAVTTLRTIVVPQLYVRAIQLPYLLETPLGGAAAGAGTALVAEHAEGDIEPLDVVFSALIGAAGASSPRGRPVIWPRPSPAQLRRMKDPAVQARLMARARATAPQSERPYFGETQQLKTHFKHAKDFKVLGGYNRSNGQEFDSTLAAFVAVPTTVRMSATYRRQPAIVYADYASRRIVLCRPDGRLWTAMKLTDDQWWYLWNKRKLGGG